MSRNRVIGKDNQLPWHLPNDLRHFKRTTLGQPIITGRLTFESTGGALPGRTNIVVTSRELAAFSSAGGKKTSDKLRTDNVVLARSVEEALTLGRAQAARDAQPRCFVCGGAAIYEAALELADELFMTQVDVDLPGDAFFPEFDLKPWDCVQRDDHTADERHPHDYSFLHYRRANPSASTNA